MAEKYFCTISVVDSNGKEILGYTNSEFTEDDRYKLMEFLTGQNDEED